ncbi:hypothetical protein LINPERHAP2_LOCUS4534, partial [Linum perenne]
MCDCGLPAKVYPVEPMLLGCSFPHRHYLGCPQIEGKCEMRTWCKVQERAVVDNENP